MPDRALAAGREQRELDLKRGAERDAALASGLIADILQARGQLDEALKIRNEEQLPVYERLGDVHARALTMGRIAGILQARGDLDGSLRIRREQELPVYERLGDARFCFLDAGTSLPPSYVEGESKIARRLAAFWL